MPVVVLSIVSLLPQRYRGHWMGDDNLDVRRGAILFSAIQFVGCSAVMWALYRHFFTNALLKPLLSQRQAD